MATISWSEDLSVGVHILDADHRLLISLINKFEEVIESGAGNAKISILLDGLYDYTDFHFIREEILMRACGYADVDAHHLVHEKLCAQMMEISKRHASDPSDALNAEIREFLNSWLIKHIKGQDLKYVPDMVGKELEIAKAHASLIHQYSEVESAESTDVV